MDIYREATLTQAGLEEYTRVQHSQQASYAQSEGYHSYVSSVDSTTNTPFLDRYVGFLVILFQSIFMFEIVQIEKRQRGSGPETNLDLGGHLEGRKRQRGDHVERKCIQQRDSEMARFHVGRQRIERFTSETGGVGSMAPRFDVGR